MMERFRYENPVERIVVDIRKSHGSHGNFPLQLEFLHAVMPQSPLDKFLWRKRQKKTPLFL